jgi:hypothetical protein
MLNDNGLTLTDKGSRQRRNRLTFSDNGAASPWRSMFKAVYRF